MMKNFQLSRNLALREKAVSELERIELRLLLDAIYHYYGLDFRDYSFASIRRRVWHRIRIEGLKSISGLQERVLHDASMMEKLFNDFSINVTEMFRDPEFFKAFRNEVAPKLRGIPQIRIWHAGCSSGEEVYSMAILLEEEGLLSKTRIYATDMNEQSIVKAQQGLFSLDKMKLYTKNYLAAGGAKAFSQYYTVKGKTALFDPRLAQSMVFAQHNLVTDGSFNEFHVIICRNVFIYFNDSLQERVQSLFYDSLAPRGFLGLGPKESLNFTAYRQFYAEVDHCVNIYQKVDRS